MSRMEQDPVANNALSLRVDAIARAALVQGVAELACDVLEVAAISSCIMPILTVSQPMPVTAPTPHAMSAQPSARHIPLSGQPQAGEGVRSYNELSLAVKAYRLQLLAGNIANADTPNYKAVDIDFAEALKRAQSAAATQPLALTTTSAQHLSTQRAWSLPPILLKYRVPNQASIDGNTVELDVELNKFSQAAIRYQFSLDRVSGHYKEMARLLTNLK